MEKEKEKEIGRSPNLCEDELLRGGGSGYILPVTNTLTWIQTYTLDLRN